MTRATRQLWEERERFLKFERGWDPSDDDIEELDLDVLALEDDIDDDEMLGLPSDYTKEEVERLEILPFARGELVARTADCFDDLSQVRSSVEYRASFLVEKLLAGQVQRPRGKHRAALASVGKPQLLEVVLRPS